MRKKEGKNEKYRWMTKIRRTWEENDDVKVQYDGGTGIGKR
jgi:hypothetical protein